MTTRFLGIAGLALGLTTLGGGVAAVSAHGSTAVPLSASVSTSHLVGAGLSAPLYQLAPDPACAAQDQNQPDAAEANAADAADTDTVDAADTDTVDLQCGDQTGADATDSATEADNAAGDQTVDGLVQQGENQG